MKYFEEVGFTVLVLAMLALWGCGEGSSDSARPEHDAANRVARLRRTSTSEHRRGSAARIADNSIDPELVLSIVQAVSDSIYARLLATMSATAEE